MAVVLLAHLAFSTPVLADGTAEAPASHGDGLLHRAWGEAPAPSIYLGMWTRHLTHTGISNNEAFGGSWRGLFGGTFINSYHTRSYALAMERRVVRRDVGPLTLNAGYRVGLIQGYDRRLLPVAGRVPVVPLVQLTGDAMMGDRFGLQASFCVKVVTWGGVVRF